MKKSFFSMLTLTLLFCLYLIPPIRAQDEVQAIDKPTNQTTVVTAPATDMSLGDADMITITGRADVVQKFIVAPPQTTQVVPVLSTVQNETDKPPISSWFDPVSPVPSLLIILATAFLPMLIPKLKDWGKRLTALVLPILLVIVFAMYNKADVIKYLLENWQQIASAWGLYSFFNLSNLFKGINSLVVKQEATAEFDGL